MTEKNLKTKDVSKNEDFRSSRSSLAKWKDSFMKDLKDRKLIPLKILMFIIFGANWALLPFLSLQARALGITGEEVGIIYSFLAIPALVAPPLVGILADKVGNFKILLSFTTILSALMSLLFIVVPVGRLTHTLPDRVSASISCSAVGNSLYMDDIHGCQSADSSQFNITYTKCSIMCQSIKEQEVIIGDVVICNSSVNCHGIISDGLFQDGVNFTSTYSDDTHDIRTLLQVSAPINGTKTYAALSPLCPNPASGYLKSSNNSVLCTTTCHGHFLRKDGCTEHQYIEEFDTQLTFYSHLFIRFFFGFTLASSMPLTEGALVTVVKNYGGDFGFQRIYANLGMMFMTPISGMLVDYFSDGHDASSYNLVMYIYCIMKLIGAGVIFMIDLEFKVAATTVTSDLWQLLQKFEVIAFIVSALFAGQLYGIIETFLFWLLEDLGADRTMMGFTVTVGSGFGCILLLASSYFIKRLGYINTIVISYLFYIIRFLGYTLISNPWAAMPFEAMEAVTTSLILVTFMGYSAQLSTPTTVVTLQGIYMGLYHGVGRATGSMLGGYLIDVFGIIITFRALAVASGICGIVYYIVYNIYKLQLSRNKKSGSSKTDNANTKIEISADDTAHDNPGFRSD